MLRRTLTAGALALAAIACEPGIAQVAPPASVATAVFDPKASQVPLPNDLVFQADLTKLAPAQAELLTAFVKAGGFPSDQEVAVTIDFTRNVNRPEGGSSMTAVQLDLQTLRPDTLVVLATTASGQGPVALDPIKPADYVTSGDRGTLTLHNKGRQPWAPGRYLVLVRGGPGGVRTAEGDPVYASSVFYLVAQGKDLTDPANIGLIRAQSASAEEALGKAQELNQLIKLYKPAFDAADQVFPHQELAVLTTFAIAPAPTAVQLDPNRGLVPLPIDLLRDPRPGGKLTPIAACTLASGKLDAAGNCSSPLAAGFATLDGFSTTAPILAPVSGLLRSNTINGNSVFLYDLTNPAAPKLVDPSTLVYEPCEFTSGCPNSFTTLSPLVAVQPVGATDGDPSSVFRSRPLKDNTSYAVVITDRVQDKTGAPLGIGTVGRILLFDNPLNVSGKSQLAGIDDLTTGALEVMRQQLKPVLGALAAGPGVSKDHVAMAYTFKTQSILGVATQLGALPYTLPAATALPTTPAPAPGQATAAAAFTKYGVDGDTIPANHIGEVLETTITTFNLLDNGSGAFNPDPRKAAPETIKVLIVTPKASNKKVPACTGALSGLGALGLKCAPMMIFRHGLGGGRADVLAVADTFASAGIVTVAIDAAKHGDRTFCSADNQCLPGGTCVHDPALAGQGDPPNATPGTCSSGLLKAPVSPSLGAFNVDGIPYASANFLISANFFRTRDTLRQDIIDQSQLVRALAFIPGGPPNAVFDRMSAAGVVIDPTQVYYSGQSLGAIQGTMTVATNPRISKAVLNVGGGTLVDVFTTSPAFSKGVGRLLASIGIVPGTSQYLQFLVVAKTILDPADPINFAGHLTAGNLANLLPPLGGAVDGSVAQAPKKILQQVAFCDQVVPNPWNFSWASVTGTGPQLSAPGSFFVPGATGTFQLFYTVTGTPPTAADPGSCPAPGGFPIPDGAVTHAFMTDWVDPIITLRAQTDAAAFLATDTNPSSLVVLQ